MKPLLSIVIANYNYGRFLEEAIQSVLNQSCREFELIICDGASTDNSVEVIKRHADRIAWWCSERDKGQSDAFNKGFSNARGRFLTWLNADDVMLPGTIEKLKAATEKHPDCEWFVGGCFWVDKSMHVLKCRRAAPMSRIQVKSGQLVVWGPSSFFTKRMLDAVGGVDERFQYTMDADLWRKFAYLLGAKYRVFSDYAWGLRLHEDAKMSGQNFDPAQQDPNHPRWKQIRKELEWMLEYYRPMHGMNTLRRLMSISPLRAMASRMDSARFKGMDYLAACKRLGLT